MGPIAQAWSRSTRSAGSLIRLLASAALAGLLALSLLASGGLGGASLVQAAGTSFSSCPTGPSAESTFQAYLNTGGTISYSGTSPCTITLTSPLTIGAGASITIDGGVGLTLDQTTSRDHVIDITDSAASPSTLTLDQVTVEGGYDGIFDGALAATVTLTESTVRDNGDTGIEAGRINLTQSTVSDNGNSNLGSGGFGISAYGGSVTLTNSTVSDNGNSNADTGGFGIDAGNVSLTNSTVSDNGNGGNGGFGIQALNVAVIDSTISGNASGGIGINAPTSLDLTASIVANPGARNCLGASPTDHGYNLATDDSCGLKATGSQNNVSSGAGGLNLLPLGNYGGPTETIALGPGSIAIDAIPTGPDNGQTICLNAAGAPITDPTSGDPITTDQRGIPRPQGDACDIGAYELIQGNYSQTEQTCPTQAQLQGDLGLASPLAKLTINLPPDCTIDLTSSLEVGAGVNITLNGNGLVLDGQTKTFDVIDIHDVGSASTLNLNQVTIKNGLYGINDPINLTSTLNLTGSTVSGNSGFGISAGTVNVTDSTVSGNDVDTRGAGIFASVGATVTNSAISDNLTGSLGIEVPTGTATVSASTVNNNGDDGIYATTASVTNSTLRGNRDGIDVRGSATVTLSTISRNNSVGIEAPNATLTGSIIEGNAESCYVTGTLTDGGYNLSTDPTCLFGNGTGSKINVPETGSGGINYANGGALANYGGPTETIALGPGSIAIEQIPVGATATIDGQTVVICSSATDPAFTDQRGIDRPQGPMCDIGAYEAPAVTIATTPAKPASSGWYNATTLGGEGKTLGVTVSFSGLATGELPGCGGATFTGLPTTAVSGLNQSANGSASLGDGTYTISCGVKQGTSALGVSQNVAQPITLKIDTTPPVITSPVANGQYLANQPVTLGCADPSAADGATGSGIQTCAVTVKEPNGTTTTVQSGAGVPTSQTGSYTVTPNTVTDVAGNAETTSFTYTVGYRTVALPGTTTTVNPGYYALIRFYPADANGHDEASRTLKVTSVALDGPGGQVIPFVHQFQYGTFSGQPGYQLALNTRTLSTGTWTLVVQIGSGAQATTGTITFTVE